MSPLFFLLGLVDTLAAALIFLPAFPFSDALIMYIMVYMIAKGGFFLFTGIASKMNPICLGMCVIDILTGIVLGAMSMSVVSPLLKMFGIISLAKGLYSVITPIFS